MLMGEALSSLPWAPCCLGCCEGQGAITNTRSACGVTLGLGYPKDIRTEDSEALSILKIQVVFENESIYFSALFFPMFSRNCFKNT